MLSLNGPWLSNCTLCPPVHSFSHLLDPSQPSPIPSSNSSSAILSLSEPITPSIHLPAYVPIYPLASLPSLQSNSPALCFSISFYLLATQGNCPGILPLSLLHHISLPKDHFHHHLMNMMAFLFSYQTNKQTNKQPSIDSISPSSTISQFPFVAKCAKVLSTPIFSTFPLLASPKPTTPHKPVTCKPPVTSTLLILGASPCSSLSIQHRYSSPWKRVLHLAPGQHILLAFFLPHNCSPVLPRLLSNCSVLSVLFSCPFYSHIQKELPKAQISFL